MNTINNYLLIFLWMSFLLLVGCVNDGDLFETNIDIDIPSHDPEVVVVANFVTDNNSLFVQLTPSYGILEQNLQETLDEAIVELYEGETLIRSFDYFSRSLYKAPPLPFITNQDYTLKIKDPRLGAVESSQLILDSIPITTASYKENAVIEDGVEKGELTIVFNDPVDEKNFYAVRVIIILESYDNNLDSTLTIAPLVTVTPLDPILQETQFEQELIMSDATFNGAEKQLRLAAFIPPNNEFNKVKGIKVLLLNIPEDKYLFERSLSVYEESKDNPFAEPIVTSTNIENGNGIFSISSDASFLIEL